jgi:hypothetical protein
MAQKETDIQAKGVNLKRLEGDLATGTALDLRNHLAADYRQWYGSDHGFVDALQNHPEISYYRIDSMSAACYSAATLGMPTIVFIKNFLDCAPQKGAGEWASAEEQFWDYFGCDIEGFVRAVEAGHFIPTVGPASMYTGPFMRTLFEALARVDDPRRPVHANAIQLTLSGERPSDNGVTADARSTMEKVEKSGNHLLNCRYRLRILGQDSFLEPVVPRAFLKERFEWFDFVLPKSLWPTVEARFDGFMQAPDPRNLDRLMDLVHVFNGLFGSPAFYSKGPTSRVCSDDILHWEETLASVERELRSAVVGQQVSTDRVNQATKALSSLAPLAEQATSHLPTVIQGVDDYIRRHVPSVFQGSSFARFVTWLDKWVDRSGADMEWKAKKELHATILREGARLTPAEAQSKVTAVAELVGNNALLLERFHAARRTKMVAYFGFGVTAAGLVLRSAATPLKVVHVGAKLLDHWQANKGFERVCKDLNPNFQVNLELVDAVRGPIDPSRLGGIGLDTGGG